MNNESEILPIHLLCLNDFIRREKKVYDKLPLTSFQSFKARMKVKYDVVSALQFRRQQVDLMLRVQRVKHTAYGFKESHQIHNRHQILQAIIQPEHFPRTQSGSGLLSSRARTSSRLLPGASSSPAHGSPWEGTEYKYQLLKSLKDKLLKKLILQAWKYYIDYKKYLPRQLDALSRLSMKKLLQLCFYALKLEYQSNQYLYQTSQRKAKQYIITKHMKLNFHYYLQHIKQWKQQKILEKESILYHHFTLQKHGFSQLYQYTQYCNRIQLLSLWSYGYRKIIRLQKSFCLWLYLFIQKQSLRQEIVQHYLPTTSSSNTTSKTNNNAPARLDTLNASIQQLLSSYKQQSIQYFKSYLTHNYSPITTTNNNNKPLSHYPMLLAKYMSRRHHRNHSSALSRWNTTNNTTSVMIQGRAQRWILQPVSKILLATLKQEEQHLGVIGVAKQEQEDEEGSQSKHRRSTISNNNKKSRIMSSKEGSRSDNRGNWEERLKQQKQISFIEMNQFTDMFIIPTVIMNPKNRNTTTTTATTSLASCDTYNTAQCMIRESFNHAIQAKHIIPAMFGNNNNSSSNVSVKSTMSHLTPDPTLIASNSPRKSNLKSPNTQSMRLSGTSLNLSNKSNRFVDFVTGDDCSSSHTSRTAITGITTGNNSSKMIQPSLLERLMHISMEGSANMSSSVLSMKYNNNGNDEGDNESLIESFRSSDIQSRYERYMHTTYHKRQVKRLLRLANQFLIRLIYQSACTSRAQVISSYRYHQQQHHIFCYWQALYKKSLQQHVLCDQIYCCKLLRTMLHAWYDHSCVQHQWKLPILLTIQSKYYIKSSWRIWKECFGMRLHIYSLQKQLRYRMKIYWFRNWKEYAIALKQRSKQLRYLKARQLRPIFQQWYTKYQKKALLRRVFTIQETAYYFHQAQQLTHYQLLQKIISGWSQYTKSQRSSRQEKQNEQLAWLFRGYALLQAHFLAWKSYRRVIKFTRRWFETRNHNMLRYFWQEWQVSRRISAREDDQRVAYLQHDRVVKHFQHWKGLYTTYHIMYPTKIAEYFALRIKLKHCFKNWLLHYRLARYYPHSYYHTFSRSIATRSMNTVHEMTTISTMRYEQYQQAIYSQYLSVWKDYVITSQTSRTRLQRGCELLSNLFTKYLMKSALFRWPGYLQIKKLQSFHKKKEIQQQLLSNMSIRNQKKNGMVNGKKVSMKLVDTDLDEEFQEQRRKQKMQQQRNTIKKNGTKHHALLLTSSDDENEDQEECDDEKELDETTAVYSTKYPHLKRPTRKEMQKYIKEQISQAKQENIVRNANLVFMFPPNSKAYQQQERAMNKKKRNQTAFSKAAAEEIKRSYLPRSLLQQAFDLGYVTTELATATTKLSPAESSKLPADINEGHPDWQALETLLQTILLHWKYLVARQQRMRMNTIFLRNRSDFLLSRRLFLHWMKFVPKIANRFVTWIRNPLALHSYLPATDQERLDNNNQEKEKKTHKQSQSDGVKQELIAMEKELNHQLDVNERYQYTPNSNVLLKRK